MKRTIYYTVIFFILLSVSNSLTAQELDSLKAEVKSLKEQVKILMDQERQLEMMQGDSSKAMVHKAGETKTDSVGEEMISISNIGIRETNNNITGADLIESDFPGSWPMFGSNLRMKIGGYFKADFVYDNNGTLDKAQFLMSTIPVEGTPEHGNGDYIYFFAKETRLNFDIRRVKEGAVPLRVFIEGDFWAAENYFHLRHAYLTIGNFIIGQTWTTLSFLESLPFLIDFGAGDALFGGRTTQIRYQGKVNDHLKLTVAAEYLSSMGIENPDTIPGFGSSQLPLFAVRADIAWNSGILFIGSSIAQLRWDGRGSFPNATAVQYDAVIAGRQYIGKRNYVTWNISGGVGSGENIMAFSGSSANAVLNEDGTLETMPAFAFVFGFMHKWSENLSSNFSYAYGWLKTPPSRAPLALQEGGIGHVNLIWCPTTHLSFGAEYMWGAERTVNDALGKAQRYQVMAKVDF